MAGSTGRKLLCVFFLFVTVILYCSRYIFFICAGVPWLLPMRMNCSLTSSHMCTSVLCISTHDWIGPCIRNGPHPADRVITDCASIFRWVSLWLNNRCNMASADDIDILAQLRRNVSEKNCCHSASGEIESAMEEDVPDCRCII